MTKVSAVESKHPYDNHPAVGLLDCVRGVNNKRFELLPVKEPGPNCRHCGFDKEWHQLKPNDCTGERDSYWQKIADTVAASPKIAFDQAAPAPVENAEPNTVLDMNALRTDITSIRRAAEEQGRKIVEAAQLAADQQIEAAKKQADAIAQQIAASVRESMAAAQPKAKS